jgi:hypothetical protein
MPFHDQEFHPVLERDLSDRAFQILSENRRGEESQRRDDKGSESEGRRASDPLGRGPGGGNAIIRRKNHGVSFLNERTLLLSRGSSRIRCQPDASTERNENAESNRQRRKQEWKRNGSSHPNASMRLKYRKNAMGGFGLKFGGERLRSFIVEYCRPYFVFKS